MTKLPEGRKPLPNEWFVDRAKKIQPDEEWQKCVSCGGPAKDKWCGFCMEEE